MKTTLCLIGALMSLATARLNAQTFYDPTFGNNGISYLDSVDAFYGVDMALQDDQKILILVNGNCGHGFLCRLNTNGSLDPSFTPSRSYRTYPVYHPGVIEMQGTACNPNMSVVRQLSNKKVLLTIGPDVIIQFNSNGTLDTLFGSIAMPGYGSIQEYNNPASIRNVMDVKEQPGVGVLFAGSSFPPPDTDSLSLARMRYDGSLDRSFGTNGYVRVAIPPGQVGRYSTITAIRFLSNNKVLVAGSAVSMSATLRRDLFLALYDLNGQLDRSFGTNGVRIIDGAGFNENIWNIAVDSNTNNASPGPFYIQGAIGTRRFIAKLDARGTIMSQFGTNGFTYFPHLSHNGNGYAFGSLSANNYLFTSVDTGTASLHTYTCYNPDGTINAQYPNNGRFTSTGNDRIVKLIGQRDGKILALGTNGVNPRVHRFVAYETDKPTSVPGINEKPVNITVSPNPFDHEIHLELKTPEPINFELVNSVGQVVYRQQIREAKSVSLPIPELAAGIYFYTISSESQQWTQQGKLIKQ
jgi:uncharacterized delta-60 repeat protein